MAELETFEMLFVKWMDRTITAMTGDSRNIDPHFAALKALAGPGFDGDVELQERWRNAQTDADRLEVLVLAFARFHKL